MTCIKLGRHWKLIYTSVTRHILLILLTNQTLLLMLLHRPLVISVVEPIHSPKQFPRLPPIATATLMSIIFARLIRIAEAPVVFYHVTFAIYVTAVYIRNRGAAALVCPAGWTWVEELWVRRRSIVSGVLSGLNQV